MIEAILAFIGLLFCVLYILMSLSWGAFAVHEIWKDAKVNGLIKWTQWWRYPMAIGATILFWPYFVYDGMRHHW